MKSITQPQADLLVKAFGRTYEEVRNWTSGYAFKVIQQEMDARKAKKAKKNNDPQLKLFK
jgi:hypothetical protein